MTRILFTLFSTRPRAREKKTTSNHNYTTVFHKCKKKKKIQKTWCKSCPEQGIPYRVFSLNHCRTQYFRSRRLHFGSQSNCAEYNKKKKGMPLVWMNTGDGSGDEKRQICKVQRFITLYDLFGMVEKLARIQHEILNHLILKSLGMVCELYIMGWYSPSARIQFFALVGNGFCSVGFFFRHSKE